MDSATELQAIESVDAIPGVQDVSLGVRPTEIAGVVEPALFVYAVASKRISLPYDIENIKIVPCDVDDGPVAPGNTRMFWISGGAQIGAAPWQAGTLGCCVTAQSGQATLKCVLTAAHVLMYPDPTDPTKRLFYEECCQPASSSPSDQVAHYFNANRVLDACLYVVDDSILSQQGRHLASGIDRIAHSFGPPIPPQEGMKVRKFGQKTGLTWGVVFGVLNSGRFVIKPDPTYLPVGKPVGLHGDSGALWITRTEDGVDHPVGLLTAGKFSETENYSSAISTSVLQNELKIVSFTAGEPGATQS